MEVSPFSSLEGGSFHLDSYKTEVASRVPLCEKGEKENKVLLSACIRTRFFSYTPFYAYSYDIRLN